MNTSSLPPVQPEDAAALERAVARHRGQPRKPSVYGLLVAAFLVLISVTALEGWAAILVSALGALNALVFLAMHVRHAHWLADTQKGRAR